jgi:tetratricopeptide (TPR) repeat protein
MTHYLCKNFNTCDKADQRRPIELAPGSDARCPECGSALHATGQGPSKPEPEKGDSWKKLIPVLGAVVLVGGAVAGYVLNKGRQAEAQPTAPALQPAETSAGTAKRSECIVASTAPQGAVQTRIDQHSQQAEDALKKGQSVDARQANDHALALQLVKSAITNLGQGRLADAESDLKTALERDPDEPLVDYNVAIVRLRQAQPEAALKSLEQAFCKGFKSFAEMEKDTDLEPLRATPAFAKLVAQYRPQ